MIGFINEIGEHTLPHPLGHSRARALDPTARSPALLFLTLSAIHALGLNPPSPKDLHPRKGEAYLCRESFAFADASLGDALFERMRPFLPQDMEGRYAPGGVGICWYH